MRVQLGLLIIFLSALMAVPAGAELFHGRVVHLQRTVAGAELVVEVVSPAAERRQLSVTHLDLPADVQIGSSLTFDAEADGERWLVTAGYGVEHDKTGVRSRMKRADSSERGGSRAAGSRGGGSGNGGRR